MGIFESHATAFAYRLLQREVSAKTRNLLDNYITKWRVYKSIEKVAEEIGRIYEKPIHPDFESMLHLGDFALDGKFIDLPGIVPPVDYITTELPYVRYRRVMERMGSVLTNRIIQEKRGLVSMVDAIEVAIAQLGDVRPHVYGHLREQKEGLRGLMQAKQYEVYNWVDKRSSEMAPISDLPGCQRLIEEIAASVVRFLKGVELTGPDGKMFDPTPAQIEALCEICRPTVLLYGTTLEVHGSDKRPANKAETLTALERFHHEVYVNTLLTGKSELLSSIGDTEGFKDFIKEFGVSTEQILKNENLTN
jgi:hypothetical protein